MKYRYEDLHPDQFENLITLVCFKLLGLSVQAFSTGPDGGRDGRFHGTAQMIPSTSSPWNGKTIIQAKHTNGYNKSFSESDFFSESSKNCTILEELPRIQNLVKAGDLEHYILFSNRKLSANTEYAIRNYIAKNSGIADSSIYLVGVESLEMLFKQFPEIPEKAGIDPIDAPLLVSPDLLSEVVEALSYNRSSIATALDQPPTPRIPYEKKNSINNLTPEYAKAQRKNYLKETATIKEFLGAPGNDKLLECYESVAEEFHLQIISKRKNYQTFDQVMEYLARLLFDRDPILSNNRRLTRALLFYMYWNCDIGLTEIA